MDSLYYLRKYGTVEKLLPVITSSLTFSSFTMPLLVLYLTIIHSSKKCWFKIIATKILKIKWFLSKNKAKRRHFMTLSTCLQYLITNWTCLKTTHLYKDFIRDWWVWTSLKKRRLLWPKASKDINWKIRFCMKLDSTPTWQGGFTTN